MDKFKIRKLVDLKLIDTTTNAVVLDLSDLITENIEPSPPIEEYYACGCCKVLHHKDKIFIAKKGRYHLCFDCY